MTRDQVSAVVRENILAVRPDLDPSEIREDRTMEELGCSSLDRLDVVVGCLDACDLDLRAERLDGVTGIGGLVDALLAGAVRRP
ncbi:hypothetical protein ACF081_27230 [Streptomyces longwoodensis]|uniref:Carrier domain-containing protein n=1 Tax=Streptomyces longwoodensis TaxID=68231 RepID=A0A101QXN5_9ACTN|nr:hypothetical protein [Streptomyces longwoodensis]KUN37995.1 hypothetical protein AQJ30_14025 [Streptomyces longwoodensis]